MLNPKTCGVLLGLIALLISGCGQEVKKLNDQALTELNQGNAKEAAELWEKATTLSPKRAELFFNLAEAHRKSGNLTEALKDIKEASHLKSGDANIEASLAKILLLNGEQETALEGIRALSKEIRSEPELLFYEGIALVETGQAADAIKLLKAYTEKKPNAAAGFAGLGLAYLRTGNEEKGKDTLHQAIELDPNLSEAYLYLGQYHLSTTKNYKQAKKYMENVIQFDRNNSKVYLILGQANLGLQSLQEADTAFQKALKLESDAWNAYLGLAESSLRQENIEQAKRFAARAEEKAGGEAVINNFLARLYTSRNQKMLAIKEYEKSLSKNPNQPKIKESLEKLKQH
jgi:tetratricopeptide (TPR) repeat protein